MLHSVLASYMCCKIIAPFIGSNFDQDYTTMLAALNHVASLRLTSMARIQENH